MRHAGTIQGSIMTLTTHCSCSLQGTRYCESCEKNPTKRAIRLRSSRSPELTSDIVVDGVRYHVQTEKLGPKTPIIATKVFKDGKIVSSKKLDYHHLLDDPGLNEKLQELMRHQYSSAIAVLRAERPKERKMVSAYLDEVKGLLMADNLEDALETLEDALTEHPFNSFLLSYHGWLDATVNGNCERGVDSCKTAIEILKEEVLLGHEVFYPAFYLNLGRAYLAGGAKKNAADAFKMGLEADPEDSSLLREATRLGIRKRPVIPFLKRSNPLNRYIGRLLHDSPLLHAARR